MPGPAQVRSTQSLADLRKGIARFEMRAMTAIELLSAELQRSVNWIEHQQPAYWKNQLRLATDNIQQCKVGLERCLTFQVVEGERPACREERDALEAAKLRLEVCRQRTEAVKHWRRKLNQECYEYQGRLSQLRQQLESDMPLAKNKLAKLIDRLAEYQTEHAPAAAIMPSQPATDEPKP